MIKGKFYTGLTSEMMSRSKQVNRQATNFFWPDESETVSVTQRPKRTISRASPISTNNNNNNKIDTSQSPNITPRELSRKQLSSGIEFYDNVNAKTPEARRRRFKKIDNINLNNNDIDFQPEKKKLETFSSKIEFYDFEHENNAKNAKNEKPVKNVVEVRKEEIKTRNESPEVTKKRISFQTQVKPVEKTKSILKNSDEKSQVEKVLVKPLPKRGLLPKNLSKSVENISKLAKNIDESDGKSEDKTEKLSTIIREVKNMNLLNERSRKMDDYDREERDPYYRDSDKIAPRRSNIDRDNGSRNLDRHDDRGYRESEYKYRSNEHSRNDPYRYNDRYDDYDGRSDRDFIDRRYERPQRISYSQPQDSYEYRERSRRIEESPIRGRNSPIRSRDYDRYGYDRDYEIESRRGRTPPIRDNKPIARKPIEPYYDEQPVRPTDRTDEEYSACISRKPKHVPQHLRTNILFNGRVLPQAQRPMSVRNSAVTRVGVGLPDIE